MKKTLFILTIIFLVFFTLGSCSDAIFNEVWKETKKLDPRIQGSSTKFVEWDGYMYVASGKNLYRYINGNWDKIEFGSWIRDIAATTDHLYICYDSSGSGAVTRISSITPAGGKFNIVREELSLAANAQSIFAANNVLFISSLSGTTYSFHCENYPEAVKQLDTGINNPALLRGVAYQNPDYLLCTTSGIFWTNSGSLGLNSASLVPDSAINFTGIINLQNTAQTVVAITRNGVLHSVTKDSVSGALAQFYSNDWTKNFYTKDHKSNGALALWKNDAADANASLLLAGLDLLSYSTGTGYTYGYAELSIDDTGVTGSRFFIPGDKDNENQFTSGNRGGIEDNYKSSLGQNPVNHIIQTPLAIDAEMTLFASTHQNGVFSYRIRNGKWEWNAEE